ncbi:MAG TPA: protein-disulfide reductase DsbD domain-containing protein [Chthoniobacterales bacterium]|nr:protein-disulfide reductase DsbD domain-containing protein [Chthoniobacterales bacterium]
MIASRPLRNALLAIALFIGLAQTGRGQTYEGRELVRAELMAEATAIVPGEPITVGVLLRMAPHWHTYWKFPGDAGLPTEIKWDLPPDWKVGEIQWPIPLKLKEPGDIQIYGYHDEVLLMQELTPPASLTGSTVKLAAQVNWLVCEKICIPGGAKPQLELPVADQNAPANEEFFARYRRSLPQDWPENNVASARWTRSGSEFLLAVESAALANYPVADFFPLPDEKVVVGHPQIERGTTGKVTFRVPIETQDPKLSSLNGIVVFGQDATGQGRNAWTLSRTGPAPAAVLSVPAPNLSGLGKFLLFGFLGGFILNLMPCVLPVISLKIFGFIQHAGQSRGRILRSGLAFIAGIFAWFVGLALLLIVLKSLGREITWAFQFTNPYFVVFMSAVVLVFALNLFGVFEISLPQTANRSLLGWTAGEGDAGSFFQGVFATVLATPCTAPFLGTALGFAFTQPGWVILAMFLAIAAGMSSPYLLLSAQPAWLRLLPKPGAWMERVKQLMGFFLLATLLFLLSVIGAQRGVEAIVWTSCFLLVLSLACWIKGSFIVPTASSTARLVSLVLVLALVIGSGLYFGEKFKETTVPSGEAPLAGDWQPFTPERLQSEIDQGHTVFVDFTAAWCLTCKFNESTVLESDAVREVFQRKGIVKIKADWTNADPAITKILQQFGRPGVPLYVLYPAGKAPIVFPELLTQSMILEKFETVTPQVAVE